MPSPGPYDFGSIMHYGANYFALDLSRPTIIPKPQYQREAEQMGQRVALSETDHNMMAVLYFSQMNESTIRVPTGRPRATVSTVPTCCWRWSDCTVFT